jgi:hypothetical protein
VRLRNTPIIGSIIQIAASAICVAMLGPGCAPIAAALSSAFVTGVTGGSLGQALRAGFIAGATAIAFNIAGATRRASLRFRPCRLRGG